MDEDGGGAGTAGGEGDDGGTVGGTLLQAARPATIASNGKHFIHMGADYRLDSRAAGRRWPDLPQPGQPIMTAEILDNVFWHCLTGPHAAYSSGTDAARRYAAGFSPIVAFADIAHPDFAALAPFSEPEEALYCAGWSGPAPAGWRIDAESTMYQMVWAGELPASGDALATVRLGSEHVAQVLDLVGVTRPGPFAARTIELGEYYGVFDAGLLVAMAGERTIAGPWREISGVCTLPAFQGRGLARRLVEQLIRLQRGRGQTPFLHVVRENTHAGQFYQRMGFVRRLEQVVRVVSRSKPPAA